MNDFGRFVYEPARVYIFIDMTHKLFFIIDMTHILFFIILIVSPILYSIAGLGIAIVNDFKSIEGDRELGLQSLPVAFGADKAKWICAGSITLTQFGVAG